MILDKLISECDMDFGYDDRSFIIDIGCNNNSDKSVGVIGIVVISQLILHYLESILQQFGLVLQNSFYGINFTAWRFVSLFHPKCDIRTGGCRG